MVLHLFLLRSDTEPVTSKASFTHFFIDYCFKLYGGLVLVLKRDLIIVNDVDS